MNILFRVDISINIGFGHFSRCYHLALYLSRFHDVSMVFQNNDNLKIDRYYTRYINLIEIKSNSNEGVIEKGWLNYDQVNDAEISSEYLMKADMLVLDHYGLTQNYIDRAREINTNLKVTVIDDLSNFSLSCDLLVNPNEIMTKSKYIKDGYEVGRYRIGTQYSIIASEFSRLRNLALQKRNELVKMENLLVCFGSMDPKGLTLATVKAKLCNVFSHIRILLDEESPYYLKVKDEVKGDSQYELLTLQNNVADQMLWADFMIGSPGGMSWERACMALPNAIVSFSNNQKFNSELFLSKGASIVIPYNKFNISKVIYRSVSKVDNKSYHEMATKNFDICDGFGSERVSISMLREIAMPNFRALSADDKDMIFKWQNEHNIRKFFSNSESPSKEQHLSWFNGLSPKKKLNFYIIQVGQIDCGFIRLSSDTDKYIVSVLISNVAQDLGLAKWALTKLIERFKGKLRAYININNIESISAFTKSGFIEVGEGCYEA